MEVQNIRLDDIIVSALNTRKDLTSGMEDANLEDLAASIKQRGLLNPITVRTREDGKYEIIAGQRRFLAFKKLALDSIPALVQDGLNDSDITVLSLIENVHRAEMNPLDKARAYKQMHDQYGTYSEVAKQANVSARTVSKYVRLLELTPAIQGGLGTSAGAAGIGAMSLLAQHFSPEDQEEALSLISGLGLEVQSRILRESGGDLGLLTELRDKALSEEFRDVEWCDEGLCFRMSAALKAEVLQRVGTEG